MVEYLSQDFLSERLTPITATIASIELWAWLARTGRRKSDWPMWKFNGGKYPDMRLDCFICQYASDENTAESRWRRDCDYCPYSFISGTRCYSEGTLYSEWSNAADSESRKECATKVLMELFELLCRLVAESK